MVRSNPRIEVPPQCARSVVLAADGRRVARIDGGALTVGEDVVAAHAVAAAALDGEVWAVVAAHGAHELRRFRHDGNAVGAAVALGALGEDVAITASRGGLRHALVEGARAIELAQADGELRLTELGPRERDRRVLITDRGVFERRGNTLACHGRAAMPTYEVPADLAAAVVVSGGSVFAGSLVYVELEARGGRHVVVYDARRGDVRARVRLADARVRAVAEQQGLLVIGRARDLGLLDVGRARFTHERILRADIAHVAVDANARRFELVAEDGDVMALGPGLLDIGPGASAVVVEPLVEIAEVLQVVAELAPVAEPPTETAAPVETAVDVARVLAREAPRCLWPRVPRKRVAKDRMREHVADTYELVRSLCASAIGRAAADDDTVPAAEAADEQAARDAHARWQDEATPVAAIARDFGLSARARLVLVLVAAPYLWGELAAAYREVAGDHDRPLVDEHLVCELLGIELEERHTIARELDERSPLVRHGLIEIGKGARPFAPLSVTPGARARLGGAASPVVRAPALAGAAVGRFAELADELCLLGGAAPARVVIRGRAGSGRGELAAALAAWAGRKVEHVTVAATGVDGLEAELLRWHVAGAIACVSGLEHARTDAAAERRIQAVIDRHPGPLVLRCAPGETPALAPGHVSIEISALDRDERIASWQDALAANGLPTAAAGSLADAFSLGRAGVNEAAATVAAGARDLGNDGAALVRVLDRTIRQTRARRLARVARPLTRLASWDELIVPADVRESLEELVGRVRLRSLVLEGWGLERATSHGVTALFQGGPGTGKTLAAGVIARELGFDLYRVDLSQVVSKWIGETEKNLAELFDAAEDGRCVLLFDEADSLLAKRTEVKSSNDRNANMEVNYILQRLDTFDGIAILTTNFGSALDPALVRRLTLQLQFPFPDEDTRERLWRAHLPPTVPTAGDLCLRALARDHEMSGGYIRNAALRAAFLAGGTNEPVRAEHLRRAIELGYRDRGALSTSGRQD